MAIGQDFREVYERMGDADLSLILADRKDLVPEAAAALDAEVARRNIPLPCPPPWVGGPVPDGKISSLGDYPAYTRLRQRKEWASQWALRLPFLLLIPAFLLDKLRIRFSEAVIGACICAILVFVAYAIFLGIQFTAYECPQCSDRFGSGERCRSCGFPR